MTPEEKQELREMMRDVRSLTGEIQICNTLLRGVDGEGGLVRQVAKHDRKIEELSGFRARITGIAVGASLIVSLAVKKLFG